MGNTTWSVRAVPRPLARALAKACVELASPARTPMPTTARGAAVALACLGPFTVVGVFRIDSLYPDATVRTIASSWNSNNRTPGWAIGITSEKSAYQPRNFILQVVTQEGYEVVASSFLDGAVAPYDPSAPEWLLGFGGFAFALLLFVLAARVLPLFPVRERSAVSEP